MHTTKKTIKAAKLFSGSNFDATTGECTEYKWIEAVDIEEAREWEGDVAGYLGQFGVTFIAPDKYAIHNLPHDAMVVADPYTGAPNEIWWVEEVDPSLYVESEKED